MLPCSCGHQTPRPLACCAPSSLPAPSCPQLYQKHAPKTVKNFLELARRGYYDGTVVRGGMPSNCMCPWQCMGLLVPGLLRQRSGARRRHAFKLGRCMMPSHRAADRGWQAACPCALDQLLLPNPCCCWHPFACFRPRSSQLALLLTCAQLFFCPAHAVPPHHPLVHDPGGA